VNGSYFTARGQSTLPRNRLTSCGLFGRCMSLVLALSGLAEVARACPLGGSRPHEGQDAKSAHGPKADWTQSRLDPKQTGPKADMSVSLYQLLKRLARLPSVQILMWSRAAARRRWSRQMILGKQIHAHEVGPAMRALVIRYHAAPRHNDSLVRVELVSRLRIGNGRRVHDRD
jgi:hypothetical protein